MKHVPPNAELNSLQDGIFRFALASREVFYLGGYIIMEHPVHAEDLSEKLSKKGKGKL